MVSKPKPFRRPSIELGKHGRSWNRIPASAALPGDVIQGRGLVLEVKKQDETHIRIVFLSRDEAVLDDSQELMAFCRKDGAGE